ncbi:YitT family protein [Desulfotomaculum nigrificans]|uniref:YitT family protein n=1 Tax=Desulfotomaculum nigrificans TaxID=1565 RepID=UPI0018DF9DAA|nr:YitT family protein [Desulfotomaculum nigrificans]
MTLAKQTIARIIKRTIFLTLGALVAAAGLELFLIPNQLVDGGIIGISIMASYLSKLPLSLFIIGLNLPFLVLGYLHIGKTFSLSTLYAVSALSYFTTILHPVPGFTNDLLLATVFGGIVLGIGVGLILRYGGSLDGTEITALILGPKLSFSVGEVVMFFNIFILGSAGFVFGWERAMYSLIAYFVAYKTIDIVIQGLEESKSVMIISDKAEEISDTILHRLGRGVTHLYAKGGYTQEDKEVLYCVVTRLEVAKLRGIVLDIDPEAFIAIEEVHDVHGGRFKKKAIHGHSKPATK